MSEIYLAIAFGTAGGSPELPQTGFLFLLFSLTLWVIALFLLHQGVAFQKWTTSQDEKAPDPEAGLVMSWVLSFVIIFLWYFYLLISRKLSLETGADLLWYTFMESREIVPAFLLASIVPAVIAIFKFLITGSSLRSFPVQNFPCMRSPLSALVGAIFAAVQLTASIATLIMFFRS